MAEINLNQAEADTLIAMAKRRVDSKNWDYPALGGDIRVPLTSVDKRENFVLDVNRGRISLSKVTYQNRGRHVVVLVRIDLGGPAHQNPDGIDIPSPHIHVYREGFADKWAAPLPADRFLNSADLWHTLEDFMRYCNIVEPPFIQRGLFV